MTDWADINARIRQCRMSSNPVACLTTLFNQTHDGHVAMALGHLHKSHGRPGR